MEDWVILVSVVGGVFGLMVIILAFDFFCYWWKKGR
jgi:hypothetical protein